MANNWGIVAVVLIMASVAAATPDDTSIGENQLSSVEPIMKGHIAALYIGHYIVALGPVANWTDPVLVSYNEEDDLIELHVIGQDDTRNSLDRARETIDEFRQSILAVALLVVSERFGLAVEESDLVIGYFNKGLDRVCTFRNGTYTVE